MWQICGLSGCDALSHPDVLRDDAESRGASQRAICSETDTPYASTDGKGNAKETITSVQALPIPPAQKEQIFGGNLRQLLGT